MTAFRSVLLGFACLLVLSGAIARSQERLALHVYSATDTSAVSLLIESFEERNPEIDVVYHEFNTNELHLTILDNLNNAGFEADVVISSAMDLQVKLVNLGLAHAFASTYAGELPNWAQWRQELYGFTYEPAAIIYNTDAFRDRRLPRTHSDLAEMIRDDSAFFDGRIGTYDIRRSGIGYLFATQDAIQDHQSSRLVESFGRARAKVFCCTSDMIEKVASGELVMSYNVIGSYALAAAASDQRIGVHLLNDYTHVMTRTAFVLDSSQHKDAAVDFIEFLLSSEGQASIFQSSSLTPINPDAVQGHPLLQALRSGQRPVIPIKLGTGLLAYLDALKKESFLRSWESTIDLPPREQ